MINTSDQIDRNLLLRSYSARMPVLYADQEYEQKEFDRNSLTTTYREEILGKNKHGSLISHYGNNAFTDSHERLPNARFFDYTQCASAVRPFLTPSYRNITQNEYMFEKNWKNYSNNYRTSDDNVTFRRLDPRLVHQQTKAPQYFKTLIKPIANLDRAAVYDQEEMNAYVNDYFTCRKLLKGEMVNIRDNFASAMQLADFIRNKRNDLNMRLLFGKYSSGQHNIDVIGDYLTQCIGEMSNLVRYMDLLNSYAVEMRRMVKHFSVPQKVISSNLIDRNLKTHVDRETTMRTELSIIDDNNVINETKDFANKILSETQIILNAMKSIANEYVNNVLEEVKKIILQKLDNKQFEMDYIRDSNGYIKKDSKKQIPIEEWTNMADDVLSQSRLANRNAEKLVNVIKSQLHQMSTDVNGQWMSTHEVVKDQIENDLKIQGDFITKQKDLKRELAEMNESIADTTRKLGTVQMINEVNLTQLSQPMPKVDMVCDVKRLDKIERTNRIWGYGTDLRNNLKNMKNYKQLLEEDIMRYDRRIKSTHAGINYDLRTIAEPRRFTAAVQPAVGLSTTTHSTFF